MESQNGVCGAKACGEAMDKERKGEGGKGRMRGLNESNGGEDSEEEDAK